MACIIISCILNIYDGHTHAVGMQQGLWPILHLCLLASIHFLMHEIHQTFGRDSMHRFNPCIPSVDDDEMSLYTA